MSIKKRETLIEMFSTFLKAVDREDYPIMTWVSDPKLERNMRELSADSTVDDEEFWAGYWLKAALQSSPRVLGVDIT